MQNKYMGGVKMSIILNDIEEKVCEVLNNVKSEKNKMIDTVEIKKAVERISKTNIKVYSFSFKEKLAKEFINCGAITQLSDGDKYEYNIILNSDKDVRYQRFSLVHEFGHIILNAHNFVKRKFVASFHIDYNINHIENFVSELNPIYENEEKANIFALCVLMPKEEFKKYLLEYNIEKVAKIFGVTERAVKSRFDLICSN